MTRIKVKEAYQEAGEWKYRDAWVEEGAEEVEEGAEEVEETDWLHPYPIRLEAKEAILFKEETPLMFTKLSVRKLPIEEVEVEGWVEYHIYVNEVKPEEAYIIEKYPELIKIIER